MKSTETLKRNYEFTRVYRKGKYLPGRHAVVHFLRRPKGPNRLGVTVGKGVRTSVLRNRLKRLLRESFRQVETRLSGGFDIVLVAKAGSEAPPYREMERDVKGLLARAGLLNAETPAKKDGNPDETSSDRPDPVL
jgi:ribonuclease P protein component